MVKKNELLEQLIEEHGKDKYVPNVQEVMKRHLPEVERFIHDVGMKLGSAKPRERTPNLLVYWRYLKWCQAVEEKPLTRNNFFGLLRTYFPGSKPRASRWKKKIQYPAVRYTYCLPEPFLVSKEEKRQAEMHLRDEMEEKKKIWAERKARKTATK